MEIVTHNPTSLAWMGDALFSCKVREHLLKKGFQAAGKLQKMSAKYCSARGQSAILEKFLVDQVLTEDESEIARRGRNANVNTIAKNADKKTYMNSTALEAVLGYLYLYGHHERLEELLNLCIEIGEKL